MSEIELYNEDCMEGMKRYPDGSIDLILTDPPYGLEFMGKDWDKGVPGVHFWQEMLRILKPGGYLLSFGGTRTYQRMACAIEDAGFEIRDMIEWVYGSGFPKSLNIGKKVEGNAIISSRPKTKGTSEWEGWGTALKPAHEPICMARKPLAEKSVAENVLKYGTGGINIDESRVELNGEPNPTGSAKRIYKSNQYTTDKEYGDNKETSNLGRFPANLIHDGSDEVRECFPETKTGRAIRSNSGGKTFGGENIKPVMEDLGYEDGGGNASRFFKSIIYTAKASKAERNKGCDIEAVRHADRQKDNGVGGDNPRNRTNTPKQNFHPTVKPIALMEYLIKMCSREGAVILDPFMGSGTTGVACKNLNRNFIGIEIDPEYFKIAEKRINENLPLLKGV